ARDHVDRLRPGPEPAPRGRDADVHRRDARERRPGAGDRPDGAPEPGAAPRARVSAPVRIGILGAARIAPMALINPARRDLEAAVVGVAARDVTRAAAFASRHGIERAYGDYDDLLRDSAIEAIYNPLPNSLHATWSIRALEAGKHVLCEKPFAANAAQAGAM